MSHLSMHRGRMILKSRERIPHELEGFRKARVTYSFPFCGDIVRRLMERLPSLEISEELQGLLREEAVLQKGLLSLASQEDIDIDLPGRFPYQKVGAEWLRRRKRGILADDQGLGKTVITVSAIDLVRPERAIIFCSVAKRDDWEDHVREWLPDMWVRQLDGNPAQRAEILAEWESGILICNYEKANINTKDLGKADLVAIDEAHELRNRKNKLFDSMKKVTKDAEYLFLLSADPTVNGAEDIWPLLFLCDRARFGSFWGFVSRFCVVDSNGFGLEIRGLKESERDNMKRILSPYVLRREGKLDLPDMTYRTVECEIGAEHRRLYEELQSNLEVEYDGQTVEVLTELSLITRLRQMALHPGLLFPTYRGPSKLETLRDVILEQSGMVVVFTHFAEMVGLTVDFLRESGISAVPYTGKLSEAERRENLGLFKSRKVQAIVITHGTGGAGLDLYEADRVIFLELAWHPAGNKQAERRILRYGQTSDVVTAIHLIFSGSIEETILDIIEDKQEVTIEAILQRRSTNGRA